MDEAPGDGSISPAAFAMQLLHAIVIERSCSTNDWMPGVLRTLTAKCTAYVADSDREAATGARALLRTLSEEQQRFGAVSSAIASLVRQKKLGDRQLRLIVRHLHMDHNNLLHLLKGAYSPLSPCPVPRPLERLSRRLYLMRARRRPDS